MRKLLVVAVFIFFGIQHSDAQVIQGTTSMNSSGDLRFGAKASLMLTDLVGKDLVDNTPAAGFQLGAAMEMPIMDEIYFAPELLFSLQGAAGGVDNVRLFYMNLPLMGKYYITDQIAAEFGPQIGILISDNFDRVFVNTNTIDVGIGFGGGYAINDEIYLQARFNYGFIKVIENVRAYNASFQVGAIYYF